MVYILVTRQKEANQLKSKYGVLYLSVYSKPSAALSLCFTNSLFAVFLPISE